jgi:hypothetical protein
MHAELRLIPRPLQEHDQATGNIQRNLPTEILFDQRKAQVDRGT